MKTKVVEYKGEDYTAAFEFFMYDGKKTAAAHLTVLKNTPDTMRKIEADFGASLAALEELGVEQLIAVSEVGENEKLKFQERFGFKPWRVHHYGDRDFVFSKSEVYNGS